MPSALKYVLDALAGIALVLALIIVFVVNFFMSRTTASANTLETTVIEDTSRARGKKLKIVVTPTQRDSNPFTKQLELWDDMGKMLDELGDGYKYDEIDPQQFLLNPKKLAPYDVMFLTCAGGGDTPEFKEMLQNFVGRGGILYASDWRYDAVALAFPDFVDKRLVGKGAPQSLDADVVDPALREYIGNTIPLNFELGDWKPSAFGGNPRVQTLLQAKYKKMPVPGQIGDVFETAPLMVRFKFGEGTVIFTSFHHEKKNSAAEKKLLQFLIFSLVTAGADAQVTGAMEKGGFTPQRSNLLSTPKNNPTVTKEYENARTSTLRFGLGLSGEGATMRLSIKSPDKKEFSQKFSSTAVVEVPNAAAGTWTYTIERIQVPYENFPFTVTVGEKK